MLAWKCYVAPVKSPVRKWMCSGRHTSNQHVWAFETREKWRKTDFPTSLKRMEIYNFPKRDRYLLGKQLDFKDSLAYWSLMKTRWLVVDMHHISYKMASNNNCLVSQPAKKITTGIAFLLSVVKDSTNSQILRKTNEEKTPYSRLIRTVKASKGTK